MDKKRFKLYQGDNIESLKKLPDNSIDSIVSDPPYGLSFMNKKWDYDVPSVEFWKEAYRVLKPGGHILSFGGTRTYHRMVVNIEDAGFEIRDQIMWIYGSGFPKSLNVGKAVDKLEGNEREVVGEYIAPDGKLRKGVKKDIMPNATKWDNDDRILTKGSSEYEGWGTALKPANEPICLARKPLSEKSVAENVLKWRTGGINVDGCRLENQGRKTGTKVDGDEPVGSGSSLMGSSYNKQKEYDTKKEGRFPANIIFDEDAAELLDEQSGNIKSTGSVRNKENQYEASSYKGKNEVGKSSNPYAGQSGGASRFFYVAKVSKKERNLGLDAFDSKANNTFSVVDGLKKLGRATLPGNEHQPIVATPQKNNHPTVKPINLLTYLCRLITPPNGIILDPFMGSGSTGIAAQLEGFRFVGMELDADYFKIAEARIENYELYKKIIK